MSIWSSWNCESERPGCCRHSTFCPCPETLWEAEFKGEDSPSYLSMQTVALSSRSTERIQSKESRAPRNRPPVGKACVRLGQGVTDREAVWKMLGSEDHYTKTITCTCNPHHKEHCPKCNKAAPGPGTMGHNLPLHSNSRWGTPQLKGDTPRVFWTLPIFPHPPMMTIHLDGLAVKGLVDTGV